MRSIYRSRTLGRSLGAFSAFAGGGRVIFGPFAFAESWSSDDYESAQHFNTWVKPYLDQVNRKDLTYEPVSSAVRTKAGSVYKVWKAAADLGSPAATGYIESVNGKMQDLIARADGLSLSGSLGHRSIGNEVARYEAFIEINNTVKQVAASATKANAALAAAQAEPVDVAPLLPSGGGVDTSAVPGGGGVTTSVSTAASRASALTTSGGLEEESGPSRTLLYVGIAAGALLLLGGGIFLGKKKRAATAGYRRRRRRR